MSFARQNELFGDYPTIELKEQITLARHLMQYFGFSIIFAGSDRSQSPAAPNGEKGRVSYALENNELLVHIDKRKKANRRFSFLIYLFGYSDKIPFAQMPRIRIVTKYNKVRVFDSKRLVSSGVVVSELSSDALTLRVPLGLLGNPCFVLSSLQARQGFLPADASSFRKIEIK